jgi:hypothetical protein
LSWKLFKKLDATPGSRRTGPEPMPPSMLIQALDEIWSGMDRIPQKAIAGGLAVAFWGFPRSTRDVDIAILVEGSTTIEAIQNILNSNGLSLKKKPSPIRLGFVNLLQYQYEIPDAHVSIDLDLLLGNSSYFKVAINRSLPSSIEGAQNAMQVVSCEDLILFKLASSRLLDLADIRELYHRNYSTLDQAYLQHWADQLGLNLSSSLT